MSDRFGDAMVVIDTDRGAGRCYRCPCGWTGWSTWGNARNHSNVCPQAWTDGEVPTDHRATSGVDRRRGPCPGCGRDVSYVRTERHGSWFVDVVHSFARHRSPSGEWCPTKRVRQP